MKISWIIFGVLVSAGLLGAAYILSSSKTGENEYEEKLKLAEDRMGELEKKTARVEALSAELSQELESNRLVIQGHSREIGEISRQLARNIPQGTEPAMDSGVSGENTQDQPVPLPEAIEAIKETVKKELKEERLAKETEQFQNWYRTMYKTESENFRKKMDENFPAFAQKIKLNTTQEYAIRDIAENAFKKIMTLIEETMADKAKEDIDWVAHQHQIEQIYKDAENQILEMVDEKQANAIREFFEDSDGK